MKILSFNPHMKFDFPNSLIHLFILFLFCNCDKPSELKSSKDQNRTLYDHSYKLTESALVSLPLDTVTNLEYTFSEQLRVADDGQSYFSSLFFTQNTITYYNLSTKEASKIVYTKEGENGLGNIDHISAHYFSHPNKAYIYNTQVGFLYHIDSLGVIQNKYEIVDYEAEKDVGFPQPTSFRPFKVYKDNVYFSCVMGKRPTDFSDYGMVLKYNLKTRERSYILPLPTVYNEVYWGDWYKYQVHFDVNAKANKIVVGSAINPYMYHADLDGKNLSEPTYFGSEYFKVIEPMKDEVTYGIDGRINWEKVGAFSKINPDFGKIIYDAYRDVYYRFVFLRASHKDPKEPGFGRTDISLIVLNTNFEKLGEFKFSTKKYFFGSIGVTEKGLWVARKDLYAENEDEITFSVFELSEE